jgi:RNA polymerase sigma factor (sigma-70 family)
VDARELEALYRTHGHHVQRRARRFLGSEEDAREVLQEVFAALLEHGASFRGESALTTWLYRAATNSCLNRLRNARTRARALDARGVPAEGSPAGAEHATILRDLLARVPRPLAEVGLLYYGDEMTHDEIAMVLGCSRRHVGDLLERLRAMLQRTETDA